jgi:hypothetical protein
MRRRWRPSVRERIFLARPHRVRAARSRAFLSPDEPPTSESKDTRTDLSSSAKRVACVDSNEAHGTIAQMWQRRRLLVWGKTYPEFSKSYYETVCTGAVDESTGGLIRIYPLTLRYADNPPALYDEVEADIQRNPNDSRPESYRINQNSFQIIGKLDTKDGWAARSRWVLGASNIFHSVEALRAAQARDGTSLGLVKPKQICRFYVKYRSAKERQEWDAQREQALAQKDLFVDAETKTQDLQFVPVQYRAVFICNDPACSTAHDLSILDWGTYVLHRRQYAQRGGPQAERDVIDKLTEDMDLRRRNAHFFLGNTMAHPASFMVVGLYFPPCPAPDAPPKQTMFPF